MRDDLVTVAEAVARLQRGELVAIPTETVYGLAADASQGAAVAEVFARKERPEFNPLIVHFAQSDAAAAQVIWTPLAERLAAAFWPGPLTLVLERKPGSSVHALASAGLPSLALRVPAHPLTQALLSHFPQGLVAPSANPSGRLSPTHPEHVWAGLGKQLPLLDGGACRLGLESSILDARGSQPILLREGALSRETLSAALDIQIHAPIRPEENAETLETAEPRVQSPGQLLRHYAPRHPLRLDAQSVRPGEALLAFGVPLASTGSVEQLSEREDLNEAAANLFAALHRLDALDLSGIAVMPIPQLGIGRAIYDRLKRGAA